MPSDPPTVFISYSHADEPWKDRLVEHLQVLALEDVLDVWDDRRIDAGDDWRPAIEDAMERARVALFLVSTKFLTSKFIRESEVPRILERRKKGLRVIPVIVHPCAWRKVPWLASIQGRPRDGQALALMTDALAEAALSDLAEEIADLVDEKKTKTDRRDGTTKTEPRVSISRLPVTGVDFVGRDDELARLDAAWADPSTHVISFVAFGGVGKSALVNRWLDRLAADGWRGAERVLGWSFYSQGTDATGASGDAFVELALGWLGYQGEPIKSAWEKGVELARLVRGARTLLVLDGLEPLQHPPGAQEGRVKDPAVAALVRELAIKNPGLCVITTRVDVDDVAGRAGTVCVNLENLAPDAGAELLRKLEVNGSEAELRKASEDFGGHGLGLSLLGTYLRDVCEGDVRRRSEAPLLDEGIKQGRHARRVMAMYEAWLEPSELQVLRLVGLFDRPAEAAALAALRAEPPIPLLTDELDAGGEKCWKQALARLRRAHLLAADDGTGLDTHPLVRAYFGERLLAERPEAWRAGHERLYVYYKQAAPELPETLEAMLPLYAAVVHGCRAGRVQEAAAEVYWRRILRGAEFFSTQKLGAFGDELTALAGFSDRPWDRPSAQLTAAAQAWILNEAGFVLRALGRLPEAVQPMRASLHACIQLEDWKDAARGAGNLSELTLTLGEVASAVQAGEESVELADRSGDAFWRMADRTTLGDALHHAGRWEESAASFREAEAMQAEMQPQYPRLYSLQGYQYCDLLLAMAEPEDGSGLDGVWAPPVGQALPADPGLVGRHSLPYKTACEAVRERASQTLEWVTRADVDILSIVLDHLSLGRAHLGLALTSGASPDFTEAAVYLDRAVDGLRQSGTEHNLPWGLLARAALRRLRGCPDDAACDLREAQEIAERGHMRLHEADVYLEWTRLILQTGDRDAASRHLARARELVRTTGYGRREREVSYLERRLG